jgi:heat shock protein HtpX
MYKEIAANKRHSVILITVFIAVIVLLGYTYDHIWGMGGYGGVALAIIISFGLTAISYFQGDKIALFTNGAKQITKEENRYAYNLIENLCITAGLPTPKIYIIDDPAINAFATGRKPELASIALSRGAIEKLTNEELEGVIAHELSHIKNYDIRFMTLVAVMVGVIALLSDMMWRIRLLGGRRSNREEGSGQLGVVLLIIGVIFAILSPIIAELIKLAISRRREYLADASGALLTRYPEGLANALEKISKENLPMQHAATATAHLYLANPFKAKGFKSLFSTHPPIEDRINKLRIMGN